MSRLCYMLCMALAKKTKKQKIIGKLRQSGGRLTASQIFSCEPRWIKLDRISACRLLCNIKEPKRDSRQHESFRVNIKGTCRRVRRKAFMPLPLSRVPSFLLLPGVNTPASALGTIMSWSGSDSFGFHNRGMRNPGKISRGSI